VLNVCDMKYASPLQICLEGRDDVVRIKTQEVPTDQILTDEMQSYFDELIQTMLQYDGIGIAANQAGQSWQVFVVHKDYSPTGEHLVVINPRMVSMSERTHTMEEGCLSVPGVYGGVERASKVRLKGLGRDGAVLDLKSKGMLARILQHEYDHLQAVVFIDKATHLSDRKHSM